MSKRCSLLAGDAQTSLWMKLHIQMHGHVVSMALSGAIPFPETHALGDQLQ